ncbi:MAG: SHOCT domain-containing protein [Jiangellales bacterium]
MTKLQQLAELKSQGLLSDAQFTAAKAKLLG